MKKRVIPKTLIKKDGTMSPEMEYNILNALEMILGPMEYFLENEPETLEEALEYMELGYNLIALSNCQINPESKVGLLFKQVNDLKSNKIEKKLEKLEKIARRDTESNLYRENINLNIEELNEEIKKEGDDYGPE